MLLTWIQQNYTHPSIRCIDNINPSDRVLFRYRTAISYHGATNSIPPQGLALPINDLENGYRHHIAHYQSVPQWYFLL